MSALKRKVGTSLTHLKVSLFKVRMVELNRYLFNLFPHTSQPSTEFTYHRRQYEYFPPTDYNRYNSSQHNNRLLDWGLFAFDLATGLVRSPTHDFYNAIKQSDGERTRDGITQHPVELGSGARRPIPDLRCSFDL